MNHGCECSWYSSRREGIMMCQRKVAHIAAHLIYAGCVHRNFLSFLPADPVMSSAQM